MCVVYECDVSLFVLCLCMNVAFVFVQVTIATTCAAFATLSVLYVVCDIVCYVLWLVAVSCIVFTKRSNGMLNMLFNCYIV